MEKTIEIKGVDLAQLIGPADANLKMVEDALKNDGHIDIEALSSVGVTGLDSYHELKKPTRLSYAKPGQSIKEI